MNADNPIGKATFGDTREAILEYGLRLADLEGVRLAALVTVELRSSGMRPAAAWCSMAWKRATPAFMPLSIK